MRVLVTGARGFVGRNLCCALKNIRDGKDRREKYQALLPLEVMEYDLDSAPGELDGYCFLWMISSDGRDSAPWGRVVKL